MIPQLSTIAVLLSVIPHLVFSSPVNPTLSQRQDAPLVNFALLGSTSDCFGFGFEGNAFSATCLGTDGQPAASSINMNACITNDNGQLVYKAQGNAFNSCSSCTLNQKTLDLTCRCPKSGARDFQKSTINLDGTAVVDGNGVFVRNNGRLSCRAPVS